MTTPTSLDIDYELRLAETQAGTGYFACFPTRDIDAAAGLRYLKDHPCDEFMHRYLLQRLGEWDVDRVRDAIRAAAPSDDRTRALLYEVCTLNDRLKKLLPLFGKAPLNRLAVESPLIYLRALSQNDHRLHRKWSQRVRDNQMRHQPLEPPEDIGLALPYGEQTLSPAAPAAIADLPRPPGDRPVGPYRARPAAETAGLALEKLASLGILADEEKRHEASLSPIGLLRQWHMRVTVAHGRHRYGLKGRQTAYGRGLDLDAARAAYAMEIVERYASFASVADDRLVGYCRPHRLEGGTLSGMRRDGAAVLDPNRLQLEAPYRDAPLWWMKAEQHQAGASVPIWIPAQAVFLFFNLDEPKLFSGRGSTGIAAGNTMAEAKVAALIEVIERYSEGVMPFRPELCFEVETRDRQLGALLESYAAAGICVQFQDLTTPMGVPCCKCFVHLPDGGIAKGTGAHLDARKALLSALTETTFPYPNGGPSASGMADLIRVPVENLPDYGTGSPEADLKLLETLLSANGFDPIYVDLTRRDLDFPVVRAIVPGMEINGYGDRFTRVHPAFFQQYTAAARTKT